MSKIFKSCSPELTRLTNKIYFRCTCLYSYEEGIVRNHDSNCNVHTFLDDKIRGCTCKYEVKLLNTRLVRIDDESCSVHKKERK